MGKPEAIDDSMWEDVDDELWRTPEPAVPVWSNRQLMEEFKEATNGGMQSLTLGALDNSFLVNDSTVQVYRNFNHGIPGKDICVKFEGGNS